jgi:hypothetical protein
MSRCEVQLEVQVEVQVEEKGVPQIQWRIHRIVKAQHAVPTHTQFGYGEREGEGEDGDLDECASAFPEWFVEAQD